MKFYYSTATCSTIAHIALLEANLSFTPIEVSWRRNVNVEELAKVNSLGAVPALVLDNGQVLTQNIAILQHIANLKPELNLLPKSGTPEHIDALHWMALASADIQKVYGPILMPNHMIQNEAALPELRDYGQKNLQKYLAHLDASLQGKDYILGKNYSFADTALFVLVSWCSWAKTPVSPYKNLYAYLKRIHARPAVQKALKSEDLGEFLPS